MGKPSGGYSAWTCHKADVPSMRESIAGPMTEVKLAEASRIFPSSPTVEDSNFPVVP